VTQLKKPPYFMKKDDQILKLRIFDM